MKTYLAKAMICFLFFSSQFLMAQETYSISGRVVDFEEQPIAGVKLYLSNGKDTVVTNANGEYYFANQKAGEFYRIIAFKRDDFKNRLTVADNFKIRERLGSIDGSSPLQFFYELPFDFNGLGGVELFDFSRSNVQMVHKGYYDHQPMQGWYFIKKSFSPTDKFDYNLKQKSVIDSLTKNSTGNDFYGYVIGDVVDEAIVETLDEEVQFQIDDVVICSDSVAVTFNITAPIKIKSGQFQINYPKDYLEFNEGERAYSLEDKLLYNDDKEGHLKVFFDAGFGECIKNYRGHLEFKLKDSTFSNQELTVELDSFPAMILTCESKFFKNKFKNASIKFELPLMQLETDLMKREYVDCPFDSFFVCPELSGGVPPYQIEWNDGNISDCRSYYSGNRIEFFASDSRGCKIKYSKLVSIRRPDEVWLPFTDIHHPTFANSGDGFIKINSIFGGTFPFEYNWSNGDSGRLIENLNAGSYTVTVVDANDCEYYFTYHLVAPISTSTNAAFAKSSNIQINPNPSENGNGILQIEVSQPQSGQLELFDMSGKKVQGQDLQIDGYSKSIELNVHLPKGIYFIQLNLEIDGRQFVRWVVQ